MLNFYGGCSPFIQMSPPNHTAVSIEHLTVNTHTYLKVYLLQMHIKAKALLLVYWISKLKHIANWLSFNVLLDLVKPFHVKPTQMNTLQKHSKSTLKHSLRKKSILKKYLTKDESCYVMFSFKLWLTVLKPSLVLNNWQGRQPHHLCQSSLYSGELIVS